MTTYNASNQTGGVSNYATGSFTSDGTIATLNVGFRPRHMKVFNMTDVIILEKMEGMAANASIRVVTAGTTTVDATSAIVFKADNTTVDLPVATVGTGKLITWFARG